MHYKNMPFLIWLVDSSNLKYVIGVEFLSSDTFSQRTLTNYKMPNDKFFFAIGSESDHESLELLNAHLVVIVWVQSSTKSDFPELEWKIKD